MLPRDPIEELALPDRQQEVGPLTLVRRRDRQMHGAKHSDPRQIVGITHGHQAEGVASAGSARENENHALYRLGELKAVEHHEMHGLETALEPTADRLGVAHR